jgi:hypothetical protein
MLPNLYEKDIKNRFIHYYRGGAFYALRYGKWKFHLFTKPGEECGYVWYLFPQKYPHIEYKDLLIFDLNQDPGERNPIKIDWFIKNYQKTYHEVLDEIKSHRQSMKDRGPNLLELYEPENKVCCDKSKNCDCRSNSSCMQLLNKIILVLIIFIFN